MRTEIHPETGAAVIQLSGKIMGGRDSTIFLGTVSEHIGRGGRGFVVDLEQVDWVNSIGIGMLLSAFKAVNRSNGRLVLSNITNIDSILTLTQLAMFFESYENNEKALATFRANKIAGPKAN